MNTVGSDSSKREKLNLLRQTTGSQALAYLMQATGRGKSWRTIQLNKLYGTTRFPLLEPPFSSLRNGLSPFSGARTATGTNTPRSQLTRLAPHERSKPHSLKPADSSLTPAATAAATASATITPGPAAAISVSAISV